MKPQATLQTSAVAHRPALPISAELADRALLSIKDLTIVVRRSEQSIRDMIRAGRFPEPDFRDGARCVRWSTGLVRRWLESATQQCSASTASHL